MFSVNGGGACGFKLGPSPVCLSPFQICLCYSELKVEGLERAAGTGHPASPLPGPLAHAISFSQLACGGEGGGWKGRIEFSLRGESYM